MSKDLKIASPEDTIKKAAQLMVATNCGALPVGENGRLLGIVTDRDITLRAVSKGNAPNTVLCARSCPPDQIRF